MDSDKIKQFFVHHVEKLIVAVVAVFSLLLIYQGLQLEDFRKEYQPDQLKEDATQVRRQIDEDHTEAIIPERVPTFDIVGQTKLSQKPVDYTAYKLRHTWEIEDVDSTIRREDPELFAPRHLVVRSYAGTIAWRSPTDHYPLLDLEPAEKPEKVEKKKRKSRREERMEAMMNMYGGEGMGMEMEEEMYMEDMYGGEMGEDGSMAAANVWKVSDDINFGITPTSVATLESQTKKEEPKPVAARFIIGTAVVPHKEMTESFRSTLKDADGYDPRRDRPRYYDIQVQRADVTDKPVDELTDEDWVLRGHRLKYAYDAAKYWAGFCPEVIPEEYRDNALTTYIPPIIIDDYRELTSHPLIPEELPEDLGDDEEIDTPLDIDQLELAGPGATGGMGGGMYEEMEMEDYGGGGYGGYGYSMMIEEDPVDYKLMRFYDFFNPRDEDSPKPGHRYVYRVRVAVVDPNFPDQAIMQPDPGTLSADVYRRIVPLIEKARAEDERFFKRWSDWSEPSEPTMLASGAQVFAGPIQAARRFRAQAGQRTIEYERDAPTAKVVISDVHPQYGTRVPFWVDVTEGSTLSAKGDANLIDPITMEVKKLPEAEIASGSTVIDLDGGQPLEIAEGEGMTEPGTMLIYDASTGKLKLTTELSDQRRYRVYSFAEDRGL